MSIFFPGEPTGPPPSKHNSTVGVGGLKAGRSVSSNPDNSMSAKAKSQRNNTTMADIDRLLEKDAVVLMNMRKDLETAQRNEITKSYNHLQEIQKKHDALHRENNLREQKILNATNVLNGLKGFIDGGSKVTEDDERKIEEMNNLLAEFNADLKAEQKTSIIMEKIWNTLKTEIMNLQVETRKCTDKLESAKHEYRVASSILQGSNQEYQKKLSQLEQLNKTIQLREQHRKAKMNQLQFIVSEGEESVARVQQSIADYSRSSNHTERIQLGGRSPFSSRHGIRSNEKQAKADQDKALAKLVATLKEMKFRYDSKEQRREKLEDMEYDLTKHKDDMMERKVLLEQQLARVVERLNRIASNRQVYKDLEEQELAIHNARKECDEWSHKDHNFTLSIDMLKTAIPRLLTKITRIKHPIPELDQLSDAIHKLEDEILGMMKNTTSILMRDATPEEIITTQSTMQSGRSDDSELERLEKLPGFERLTKQIYYNLMTAHDASRDPENFNIRVKSNLKKDNSDAQLRGSPTTMISPVAKGAKVRMQLNVDNDALSTDNSSIEGRPEPDDITSRLTATIDGRDYMDRSKLKEISALIIKRDAAKFGYTHLESTKKEKERKEYKPKFITIT